MSAPAIIVPAVSKDIFTTVYYQDGEALLSAEIADCYSFVLQNGVFPLRLMDGKGAYKLSWQSSVSILQFYKMAVPFLQYLHNNRSLLGERRGPSLVLLVNNGEGTYFSLEQFLSGETEFMASLPKELSKGLLYVGAPDCTLTYAVFPDLPCQVSIQAREDLSHALPVFIQSTLPLPGGIKVAQDLEATVAYMLQEKIFKRKMH